MAVSVHSLEMLMPGSVQRPWWDNQAGMISRRDLRKDPPEGTLNLISLYNPYVDRAREVPSKGPSFRPLTA